MAQSRPVALCHHLMPTGKLCRGVAVRDDRYCRAHIRNYRQLERDRAQFAAIERLADTVQPMDLAGVLYELSWRLTQLSRCYSITRFPEITYLLAHSIDRLDEFIGELNSSKSDISPKLTPDQIPGDLSGVSLNEINQMIMGLNNSIT